MDQQTQSTKIRSLPVILTEAEKVQRGLRLASEIKRKEDLEKKRRADVNSINEELKDVEAEIRALTDVVSSDREMREVAIEERKDLARRVLEVFRLDSGEIVDSRQLSMEECQGELPFTRTQGERSTSYEAKSNVVPISNALEGEEADDDEAPAPATRVALDAHETEAPGSPTTGATRRRRRANVPEPEPVEAKQPFEA